MLGPQRRASTLSDQSARRAPSTARPLRHRINERVATRLTEAAELLAEQQANPFRVQAYRHAADVVRNLDRSVAEIAAREGLEGLDALPGVGPSLARAIQQLTTRGRWPLLQRLRGATDAADLLATVPGIGRRSAERLQDELGITTLEDLEAAAHDGRLTKALGIRGKRLAGLQDGLAGRLGRTAATVGGVASSAVSPPVQEILYVDNEYRRAAAAGKLTKIAPKRFNPTHQAWLPVLHTEIGARHYTALYSNTARAHQLGRTDDWVVVYFDGGAREHQCTVVTETQGPLAERRVVRGRERECLEYYAQSVSRADSHASLT